MLKQKLDVEAIFPEIREIQDEDLRQKVVTVWQRLWEQGRWDRIEDLPVSSTIPYPHVPHNRAVAQLVLAMAKIFREIHGIEVDTHVLLAAALLQDASKLVEYAPGPDGKVIKTETGQKLGHAAYAAHVALDA